MTMTLNNLIKQIGEKSTKPLSHVATNGAKQIKEYIINCSELEDYNNIDITQSDTYKILFDELKLIKGPVLYYFEIVSDHTVDIILSKFKEYSISENAKTVPATKKTIPISKILYVGKVKRNFFGRLIQHLGYYKVNNTQGLQIFYWAKELSLSIKLTVLEFEPEMINLMSVLENELAFEFKPILGKHK